MAYRVVHVTVEGHACLPLQSHLGHSGHWVVVTGTARVTRGPHVLELTENESIFIPAGMKHCIENLRDAPLEMIEVQVGASLAEDETERYDDAAQHL